MVRGSEGLSSEYPRNLLLLSNEILFDGSYSGFQPNGRKSGANSDKEIIIRRKLIMKTSYRLNIGCFTFYWGNQIEPKVPTLIFRHLFVVKYYSFHYKWDLVLFRYKN